MLLTGLLLVSGLAIVAVEAFGYVPGGYNAAFWKLPLDDKLEHVARNTRAWWWISLWELAGLILLTGGVFGLATLVAQAGESVVANVALGIYLASAVLWLVGSLIQASAVPQAAQQRLDAGETPPWIHPLWSAGWVSEVAWIMGSNAAYAIMGFALLQTDLLASWAGWTALVGGAVIAGAVGITRTGFPQLAVLVPAVLGVAALLAA